MSKPVITTRGLRALYHGVIKSPALQPEDRVAVETLVLNLDTSGDTEKRLDDQIECEALALYLTHKYRGLSGDTAEYEEDFFAAVAAPRYREKNPTTGRLKGKDWVRHEVLADKSSGYCPYSTLVGHGCREPGKGYAHPHTSLHERRVYLEVADNKVRKFIHITFIIL